MIALRLKKWNWVLIAIAFLGAVPRVWTIGYGLPFVVHPDEAVSPVLALRMLHTGDLNPYFFDWPTLTTYFSAAAYFVFFLFGRLTGRFTALADLQPIDIEAIAAGHVGMPEEFLISRALNMIAGIAAIIVVYRISCALGIPNRFAWLAALLVAIEPALVRADQVIRPDAFAVLFCLLAAYYAIRILDDPRLRHYLLAGAFAGLGISSKYNVGLVCIAILVAHLLRFDWRGLGRKEIYLAGLAALVAFIATTPYAILDWSQFSSAGPLFDALHYSSGHAGAEGNSLNWYASFLREDLNIFLVFAVGAMAYAFWRRDRREIALASFPVVYFIFISRFTVHFDTTILPVIPFLAIFSARGVQISMDWLAHHSRTAILQTGATLALLVFAFPIFTTTLQRNIAILAPDGRDDARAWIELNLPPGSRVAIEPYAPYLSRARFAIEGFESMIDHPPEWYAQNGFEYLVFSDGSYGRYYADPERYGDFIAQYDAFFKRLSEIARFSRNGSTVRVLKTNASNLPSQRVATRFGVYGGWVELVGYDVAAPWQSGDTQRVKFYWRTLDARREPLVLTTRLVDRDNQEVASSRAPLFGDSSATGAWLAGVTPVERAIAVPKNLPAGLYRLQLEIDAEGVGRVPNISFTNQPISEKFLIGPFVVVEPSPSTDELARAHTLNAKFGNALTLVGAAANPSARPGDALPVSLYWRADSKIEKDYTVFIQLLDASDKVRVQIDSQPRGGAYPTSLWDAGRIVRDDYALKLPSDLPPGEYTVILGLYEQPSLARLNVADANGKTLGDHFILATLKVAP